VPTSAGVLGVSHPLQAEVFGSSPPTISSLRRRVDRPGVQQGPRRGGGGHGLNCLLIPDRKGAQAGQPPTVRSVQKFVHFCRAGVIGLAAATVEPGHEPSRHDLPGIRGAVGNTPLIRLHQLSALTGLRDPRQSPNSMKPAAASVRIGPPWESLLEAEKGGPSCSPGARSSKHRSGNTASASPPLQCPRLPAALIVIPHPVSREESKLLAPRFRARCAPPCRRFPTATANKYVKALGPARGRNPPEPFLGPNQFDISAQPARPLPHHRPENSGAEPAAHVDAGVRQPARAALWPGWPLSRRRFARPCAACSRCPMAKRPPQLGNGLAKTEGRGRLESPRDRQQPASRHWKGLPVDERGSDRTIRAPSPRSTTCSARRAVSSEIVGIKWGRAVETARRLGALATRSWTVLSTAATATAPASTTTIGWRQGAQTARRRRIDGRAT